MEEADRENVERRKDDGEREKEKQGREIEARTGQTEWPKVKSIGTSYFCSLTFSFFFHVRQRQTGEWISFSLSYYSFLTSTFFLTRLEKEENTEERRESSTSECCTPHVFQSITKCTLIQSNVLLSIRYDIFLLSFHFPLFLLSLLSLSPLIHFIGTFTFLPPSFKSLFLPSTQCNKTTKTAIRTTRPSFAKNEKEMIRRGESERWIQSLSPLVL